MNYKRNWQEDKLCDKIAILTNELEKRKMRNE